MIVTVHGAWKSHKRMWLLVGIDILCMLIVCMFILVIYPSSITRLSGESIMIQMAAAFTCFLLSRFFGGVYHQVWRYANTPAYLRMLLMDFIGGCMYWFIGRVIPFEMQITFVRIVSIFALAALLSLSTRFIYQYLREGISRKSWSGKRLNPIFRCLLGKESVENSPQSRRIKIAIVGAGRVGAMLAEELLNNPYASYTPICFIDVDSSKIGRDIMGLRVLDEMDAISDKLAALEIQEVVFALPSTAAEHKRQLYDQYKGYGYKIKVYDFPLTHVIETGKRQMREFDIEELLFRKSVDFLDRKASDYYRDKVVLISGGGGSIGSELCRQIARMKPRQLIILDIYENNAYDLQQELRIIYGETLNLEVEIASVCDVPYVDRIFARRQPDIVLHAAAHKHVPLMEHNCSEAVKNNVFGTFNMVNAAEKYGVDKFIMISTDKAVNPTNVMGASKCMCEMIVLSRNAGSKTHFCATRFGNVLGSNGSVIPLFKRQISTGGPVTITDKRIIRYFMTIPEASQLVLQSGAMARDGELYVLDMGKPVRILELAESMIRLSGLEPYRDIDIVETGLRPGEKLYEELLINTERMERTENNLIFIDRDQPLNREEIIEKLAILRNALSTEDDEQVRVALKQVVLTYQTPEEVNGFEQFVNIQAEQTA